MPLAPTYDVCAIGNVCIDIVASVTDDFLSRHRLHKSLNNPIKADQALTLYNELSHARLLPGGVGANVAHVMAALGGRSAFIGKAGHDDYATQVTNDLRQHGVDTYLRQTADKSLQTSQIFCLISPEGDRTFASYDGAAKTLTAADIIPDTVTSSRIVYLDSYTMTSPTAGNALSSAMDISHLAGRLSCFNPCDVSVIVNSPQEMKTLAEKAKLLICNLDEAQALFGPGTLAAIGRTLSLTYIAGAVTDGENGAVIFAHGSWLFIEPPDTSALPVIDSNGAGDHFAAGFLYAFLQNLELAQAGKLAQACALDCLSHQGARPLGSLQHLVSALTKI